MDIYSVSILLSILVYLFVGNYAGRKVKDLDDYFVVGRQAPTLLIVGTLVASFLSTNTFLGETARAYSFYAGSWLLFPPTSCPPFYAKENLRNNTGHPSIHNCKGVFPTIGNLDCR